MGSGCVPSYGNCCICSFVAWVFDEEHSLPDFKTNDNYDEYYVDADDDDDDDDDDDEEEFAHCGFLPAAAFISNSTNASPLNKLYNAMYYHTQCTLQYTLSYNTL